jgi:peptide/nickel transport system permease protein
MIKPFVSSLGFGGTTGVFVLITIGVIAIFARWIAPIDPFSMVAQPYIAPFTDARFALGTDNLGRDILAGIVHGAGSSLLVGLGAAIAAILIGTIIGTIAGFAGGVVDEILMRITEAFQIIPSFLLALAFVSTIGNDIQTVILAIALGAWADPARVTRAQVLSVRERDYIASARVIGMHPVEIALTQVLPNSLPPVLSISATIVAGAILTEAALSFIGLGDPNIITWGAMIAEGQPILRTYPALSIIPGIALLVTVLSIYLISESVNRRLILGGAPR